ncbi:MAG: BON domain-containing protein [Vicinamibacterales bacterium]
MSSSIGLSRTLGLALVVAVGSTAFAFASSQAPKPQAPPDSTVKDRIEYRLETSPVVDPYDLKVKVDASSVWLTGTVATAAQKTEAGRLAKVDGVSKVENNIDVDKDVDRSLAERTKAGMTKTGEVITDGWITTKVHWFFVGEDLLKGSDINVNTDNNVVTLKGTVTSGAGRDRAEAIAKRTAGVQRVVNQLTIIAN